MIKINFNGKEFEAKNQPSEILISDFEKISTILNDILRDEIDKYIEIFSILGIPEEIIDNMDYDEFVAVIKSMQDNFVIDSSFKKEFEINGYTYRSYEGDEFKLKVKEMSLIETYVKKNESKFIGEMMAIIFKRTDLSKTEHFEPSHIKHKAELFREHISTEIALPYVGLLSQKLLSNLMVLKNEIENGDTE
jgi:hypothetical protein